MATHNVTLAPIAVRLSSVFMEPEMVPGTNCAELLRLEKMIAIEISSVMSFIFFLIDHQICYETFRCENDCVELADSCVRSGFFRFEAALAVLCPGIQFPTRLSVCSTSK